MAFVAGGCAGHSIPRSINFTERKIMIIHVIERVSQGLLAVGMTILTGLIIFA